MRARDIIWPAVRIVVLSYAGMCVWMYFRQSRYVYFPDRVLGATPADEGMAFDDVTLRTEDGETIHGWYVSAASNGAVILLCHGNAGNLGDRVDTIRRFHDQGLDVFAFDYRGYGRSSGRPGEAGTYRDAAAAWDYLVRRGIAPRRIVPFGESLGGAVAAWLAEQRPVGAVVLRSAFTSVPDMAARLYPYLPVRPFCRIRYDTLARMPNLRCPVLVAHSPDDEVVPFAHGQALFDAAKPPKQLVPLQGYHNTDLDAGESGFSVQLTDFLARHVAPAASAANAAIKE
jgi:pimeloyl-ACP methyl ester carboxylesterase